MRAAVALAIVIAGCGGAPPPVVLDGQWPAKPGDFEDVTEAWTRHGTFRRDYQEVLSVEATFKSPEWRLAHAMRVARAQGLDATATAALIETEKAAATKAHDIELIVTTWDRKENQLARPNAVWVPVLIDSQGRSIAAIKITRDKRPKHVLRAEFPTVGDFSEAYVASFPADPPVLASGVKTVRLRLASERGNVEVAWTAP